MLFFASCVLTQNTGINITKKYVGEYVSTHELIDEKYCIVTTTMGIFFVKDTTFYVPDSALCYIRRDMCAYDMHPDIAWQMEHQYFTWSDTEKEYRLKKNVDFRRLRKPR